MGEQSSIGKKVEIEVGGGGGGGGELAKQSMKREIRGRAVVNWNY